MAKELEARYSAMVEMRKSGMTYQQIAGKFGITRQAGHSIVLRRAPELKVRSLRNTRAHW